MATATVYIHGGDYDCSELVRMCYRAVDVLPYASYMWTGNEVQLLKEHGFKERSLYDPKMGDVLWRAGHTEIYLGNGMQGGARIDEVGGITGPRKGDQTGSEVARSAYRSGAWSKLLRYEGDKTVDGIPAAVAAALVADHIIDHSAHGYSQPNRAGDGTIEEIKISWDGKAPKPSPTVEVYKVSRKETFVTDMKVRDYPSTKKGKAVAEYKAGQSVYIDGVVLSDGYVWGQYTGASSGKPRYIALGTTEFVKD